MPDAGHFQSLAVLFPSKTRADKPPMAPVCSRLTEALAGVRIQRKGKGGAVCWYSCCSAFCRVCNWIACF